jgi:NAD(P)-dependent dehydrogenase (short-subunit alcohol dehydrogenase family)
MESTGRSGLPSFRLDNRLAVVTGASEGLGRAFALAFAEAGARLVLSSRRRDKLEEVKQEIEALGGAADVVPADMARLDDVKALAAAVAGLDSGDGLVLVNNAGLGHTRPALETTEEEWDRLIDVHLKGTFFCCREIAPLMIAHGYGKIVNLSSTWAQTSDIGKAAYGAAKAGISRLTAALSTEWSPLGVRVNALAPTTTLTGATASAMRDNPERAQRLLSHIRLGRFAEPSDIVGPAIFLASGASDFVTGHTLFVDGGWTAGSF